MAQLAHNFATAKSAAEVKLPSGAETTVVTSPAINTVPERPEIQIAVTCPFTTPAESTEQHLRLYRNSTEGDEVASILVKAGASAKTDVTLSVTDIPGEQVGLKYIATLQDIAGKETVAKDVVIDVRY